MKPAAGIGSFGAKTAKGSSFGFNPEGRFGARSTGSRLGGSKLSGSEATVESGYGLSRSTGADNSWHHDGDDWDGHHGDHHHGSRFNANFFFGFGPFFWGGWYWGGPWSSCWDSWWWGGYWYWPSYYGYGFAAYYPAPVYYPVYYPTYYPQTVIVEQPVYVERSYEGEAQPAAGGEAPPAKPVGEAVKPEVNALVAGDASFRSGDYSQAIQQYERAVVMDPTAALPRFALGEALFVQGDYAYAGFVLRKGLELDETWLDVDVTKDKIYGKLADYATALVKLENFVAAHPYDSAAKFVLGYEYFVTKNYDRAKEVLTAARELGPDPAADLILSKIEAKQSGAPAEKPNDKNKDQEKAKAEKKVVFAGDEKEAVAVC